MSTTSPREMCSVELRRRGSYVPHRYDNNKCKAEVGCFGRVVVIHGRPFLRMHRAWDHVDRDGVDADAIQGALRSTMQRVV